MANEEEKVLETQLELQLHEQKDSIVTINEALSFDPTNAELLEVHEELIQSIKQAEDVLFHMKRSRLLREIDLAHPCSSDISDDIKIEPLDPTDTEPEPLKDQKYPRGSKCRFRHTDGRWYNGEIFSCDDSNSGSISFLTPTTENMLICNFFLQQRCRFGNNCRLSHGVDLPFSSLKKYTPTVWDQSLVGSNIWALSENHGGIWKEAELKSWDDNLGIAEIVFLDDGRSAKVGAEAISLSEYAQMSDDEEEEESDSGSDQSDCSDYEEESPQGVGFLESSSLQRGIQTETAIFATWENHTRGIASKMMAGMGFQEGMGLGAAGQGMVNPIIVKAHPHKQSLERALKTMEGGDGKGDEKKKKHRGGKRKRDQKFAAMVRAKKQQEESIPDVFSLINTQLTAHAEALNGGLAKKQQRQDAIEQKKPDRRALIGYDEEIKELKIQVGRYEEMCNRNKKEKAVYEAAMRKLNQTRKALAEAEAVHESASDAVMSKEKEKNGLNFDQSL